MTIGRSRSGEEFISGKFACGREDVRCEEVAMILCARCNNPYCEKHYEEHVRRFHPSMKEG